MKSSDTLVEEYPIDPNLEWPRGEKLFSQNMNALMEVLQALIAEDLTSNVRATRAPVELAQDLELELSPHPQSFEEVLNHLKTIMRAAPLTTGQRFFNQLFGGRDPSGIMGEFFAAIGNHSLYTYKVAGPFVLIEDLLIQRLGNFAGFASSEKRCGGIFTPGGSLSNLAAMLCARDHCNPHWREKGAIQAKIYTSAEAHYSVRKGAGIIGVGRDQVVSVPCDSRGRMDPETLKTILYEDRQRGELPMMVIATAGTTVRGAFDSIDQLADLCEAENIWLHVDGAFGGAALLTETLRDRMVGIERAQSLTWDAHKVMGVPLTCSVLLTRDEHACEHALSESASYLFQADDAFLNPGTRSLQCGRRNDALKLWSAWRFHGDLGWARRVERSRALAVALADEIQQRATLELCEEPPFLNVCFEVNEEMLGPIDHAALCDRLQLEQSALIGSADYKGRKVIRAAVINPALVLKDLQCLLDEVERLAPQCVLYAT